MPLRIHGRTYKNFYTAVRAVKRWKRIGEKRARAYVAVVMRRQEGGRRRHSSRRVFTSHAGRGGRPALRSMLRHVHGLAKRYRNVTIYKQRPKGYRYKVICGKSLVTFVKRKAFATDFRAALSSAGKKHCRVLKA